MWRVIPYCLDTHLSNSDQKGSLRPYRFKPAGAHLLNTTKTSLQNYYWQNIHHNQWLITLPGSLPVKNEASFLTRILLAEPSSFRLILRDSRNHYQNLFLPHGGILWLSRCGLLSKRHHLSAIVPIFGASFNYLHSSSQFSVQPIIGVYRTDPEMLSYKDIMLPWKWNLKKHPRISYLKWECVLDFEDSESKISH